MTKRMVMPNLTDDVEYVCAIFRGDSVCTYECEGCALESPENYVKFQQQEKQDAKK